MTLWLCYNLWTGIHTALSPLVVLQLCTIAKLILISNALFSNFPSSESNFLAHPQVVRMYAYPSHQTCQRNVAIEVQREPPDAEELPADVHVQNASPIHISSIFHICQKLRHASGHRFLHLTSCAERFSSLLELHVVVALILIHSNAVQVCFCSERTASRVDASAYFASAARPAQLSRCERVAEKRNERETEKQREKRKMMVTEGSREYL